MLKAVRIFALLLALAVTAVAGEVPNNTPSTSPSPPPPSSFVQEPAADEETETSTIDIFAEVMLNLLAGALSPF
jgi:hypothetical protein